MTIPRTEVTARIRPFACSLALSALVGCGGAGALLKNQASSDMKCPQDEIHTQGIQPYVERAMGCGKDLIYVYDHSGGQWTSPLDRATFDLSCPKEQLVATIIDNSSVGVAGCEKKAVYVLKEKIEQRGLGITIGHQWIANGP